MNDSKEEPLSDALKLLEEVDETQSVKLTFEEVKKYILKQIEIYKDDPSFNPLLAKKNEIVQLEGDLQSVKIKYSKLQKNFVALHKDQVNFRKRTGEDTKTKYRNVAVSCDMEVLPETIPSPIFKDWRKKNEKKNGPVECIDLSSDEESPVPTKTTENKLAKTSNSPGDVSPKKAAQPCYKNLTKPPVPLPVSPVHGRSASDIPPKPLLCISGDTKGITLQWRFPEGTKTMELTNYEIFGYQERRNVLPSSTHWEKIGCVKALTLPMSCTLTQFVPGSTYHFCVRAIARNKIGHFSDPASIMLVSDSKKK